MVYTQYSNATVEEVSTAAWGLIPDGVHLEAFYKDIHLEALDKDKDPNWRKRKNDKTVNPCATLVW
jgi:hypothetical protein